MSSERECRRALDEHEEELAALPNVRGLGIVAAEGEPADSDRLAVAVYVDEKHPPESLPPEQRIPETLELRMGGRVRRVPVRVIEQGPVELELE